MPRRPLLGGLSRLGIFFVSWTGVASAWAGEPRLNQIQVIGTHNSYHLAPDPAVRALIAAAGRHRAEALDYSHRPLGEQYSQLGIRQIELDVYADPEGKLFGYEVGFPGGVVARPNPVNGDPGWGFVDLESGKKGPGQHWQPR